MRAMEHQADLLFRRLHLHEPHVWPDNGPADRLNISGTEHAAIARRGIRAASCSPRAFEGTHCTTKTGSRKGRILIPDKVTVCLSLVGVSGLYLSRDSLLRRIRTPRWRCGASCLEMRGSQPSLKIGVSHDRRGDEPVAPAVRLRSGAQFSSDRNDRQLELVFKAIVSASSSSGAISQGAEQCLELGEALQPKLHIPFAF